MDRPRLELVSDGDAHAGETPFDALLAAAEEDPEAAEGLALAYAALELDARRALVSSVLSDADAAGRSAAVPLALLLAVERDRELARVIATALLELRAREQTRPEAGWTWGSDREGGIAVARHGHDGALEIVRLAWSEGELVSMRAQPRGHDAPLDELRRTLGVPEAAEPIEVEAAVDKLAEQIWHARTRRGSLPDGLRALAHLFGAY